ncbi:DinB family protein [Myroides sp. N17-2]|uniref:DinB family protein n=1 Tax=Myroides sp. N17-2 TaxID=2030799 RepID=UPI000EFDB15F|nr:DinB family protein [Myroides sp. N17-2]
MTNQQVLDELRLLTEKHIEQLQRIKELPIAQLEYAPTLEQWNILQCAAHLNHYFDFYLPQFTVATKLHISTSNQEFKPGIVGNYFANVLQYNENQKKIKSPKNTNPINNNNLSIVVLSEMENNLITLKEIISIMPIEVLNKKGITTMFSTWFKLKVGDGLRIVVYHNDRHFHQMHKLL